MLLVVRVCAVVVVCRCVLLFVVAERCVLLCDDVVVV